jgi:hypothetical protein
VSLRVLRAVGEEPTAARVPLRVLRAVGEEREAARHHAACTPKSWMGTVVGPAVGLTATEGGGPQWGIRALPSRCVSVDVDFGPQYTGRVTS